MSAATVTCPAWCAEVHTRASVDRDGYVAHHSRQWTGLVTMESGAAGRWGVDIAGTDDEWSGIFANAVDNGMTAAQARAMAQALMEAADALDAAS